MAVEDSSNGGDVGQAAQLAKDDLKRVVHEALLSELPPSVVVSSRGRLIYVHGHTGSYLEPAPGPLDEQNLSQMAREELRRPLLAALERAASADLPVVLRGMEFQSGHDLHRFSLVVRRLERPPELTGLLLVSFERDPVDEQSEGNIKDSQDSHLRWLEQELEEARAGQQLALERLASANEALQSTNEELLTANEELTQQNDELLTSQQIAEAASEALRDASQRKDEYLATLAHELRNPLAALTASHRLLTTPGAGQEATKKALPIIGRQCTHMSRMVNDLLDISRISRGQLRLRREELELQGVVAEAIDIVGHLPGRQTIEVDVSQPTRIQLRADRLRLCQVLVNLLDNACKFSRKGGSVQLSTKIEGDGGVMIRVSDSGSGIPAELLPRIFDMFTQEKQDTHRGRDAGLGIGLSLSRRLVELHNGTIEAFSEGADRGSTFTVRLPAGGWDSSRSEPPEEAVASPVADRLQILVVDDNRDAADSLGMLLGLEGHEVHVCHSGAAALEHARQRWPEAAILDIGMPDMDGYELAASLRDQGQGRPLMLVALTGWGQEGEHSERAREAGFDHHLTKPVCLDRLRDLLAAQNRQ